MNCFCNARNRSRDYTREQGDSYQGHPTKNIEMQICRKYNCFICYSFLNDPLHAAPRPFLWKPPLGQPGSEVGHGGQYGAQSINSFYQQWTDGVASRFEPCTEEPFETRMLISASSKLQTGFRNLPGLFSSHVFFPPRKRIHIAGCKRPDNIILQHNAFISFLNDPLRATARPLFMKALIKSTWISGGSWWSA
jgi:hypothetical protein